MVEQAYRLSKTDETVVKKVLFDQNLHYIHMVFSQGNGLPEHLSNSSVYMTVVRGTLSLKLNEQEVHAYQAGTLLKIPYQTKMNVRNLHATPLELIVVKAPAPNV